MITVGLDFGTHQTKICIENKDRVELSYSFMRFKDEFGNLQYTIPSVIGIGKDGLLSYGFLPKDYDGEVVSYFKQDTFRRQKGDISQNGSVYFSIWYLAYILFDLEEIYGQEFSIQMGVPTDSHHFESAKQKAASVMISAYHLVEDIFMNDKELFLSASLDELKEWTEIIPYSKEKKEEYQLLIFPEAYACLKPLVGQGKISKGMNLMIDIGGGTTDISFFNIENNQPQVYDFFSINMGLNYLTKVDDIHIARFDIEEKRRAIIDQDCRTNYVNTIWKICHDLQNRIRHEFKEQTELYQYRIEEAMKNRPLVYCGGGSTFGELRVRYKDFNEIKVVSHKDWNTKAVKEIEDISDKKLYPILSTAYGLAISTENDDIAQKPFRDIFDKVRGSKEPNANKTRFEEYGGYGDYDTWK